jgi:hypothetical protein
MSDVAGGAAAGSSGTGLGGGVVAGEAAPAGAGGASGSAAGSGGAGGTAGSLAGTGGVGGSAGMMAAAGSGGAAGGPATCPTQYTTATHMVLNVSWPASLAVDAGTDKVHIWTKSKNVVNGATTTVESVTCGTSIPDVQTSAFAGGARMLPEISNLAWASTSMPKYSGTGTKTGSTLTLDAGISLIGLTMSNPTAAWPSTANITSADHDADSKPGVTATLKETMGYGLPPVSLSFDRFADKLYFVTRDAMTLTATVEGCPQTYSGTANVTKFENHIIGCHVKGSGDCTKNEAGFVDDNRTIYKVDSATFTTKVVSDALTCAEVRGALP